MMEKSMVEKMTSVGKIRDDNNNNNNYCYYYCRDTISKLKPK